MEGTRDGRLQGMWWTAPEGVTPTYCLALGATLQQLRSRAGTARRAIARDVLKVRPNQLARYESGQAKPSLMIIAALCREYDVSVIELLTRVALLACPDTSQYETLPDVHRFLAVVMQYDEAVPSRSAIEQARAARRDSADVELT